jgi:hypothetical protein
MLVNDCELVGLGLELAYMLYISVLGLVLAYMLYD